VSIQGINKTYHIDSHVAADGVTYRHSVTIDSSGLSTVLRNQHAMFADAAETQPLRKSEVSIAPEDAVLLAALAIQEGIIPDDLVLAIVSVAQAHMDELAKRHVPPKK
jgi:hypothetical protein